MLNGDSALMSQFIRFAMLHREDVDLLGLARDDPDVARRELMLNFKDSEVDKIINKITNMTEPQFQAAEKIVNISHSNIKELTINL